ncbi:hypothetical protein [Streptomyces sp. NPDC054863]
MKPDPGPDPGPHSGPAPEPLPTGTFLTLRVSRDSGRTWGPRTTYAPDRKSAPLEAGSRFPLCECRRCVRDTRQG